VKSTTSDGPAIEETNDAEAETKTEKCCHKPFIFKILQLNLPEINWIILGCLTSIIFGTISPVNSFKKTNSFQ
jgi:hypothetical protein